MLKRPGRSARRTAIGLILAGFVVAGTAYGAWAGRPVQRVQGEAHAKPRAETRASTQASAATIARPQAPAGNTEIQPTLTPPPKYPADAVANKVSGKVVLIVDVAADGSVADAQVEKSEPRGVFDQAAIEAAMEWKFQPAMKNGKPASGRVRVPLDFDAAGRSGNDGAPMKVAPTQEANPAAYDWIKLDMTEDSAVRSVHCDVVDADPPSEVVYCGRLKRVSSQS